MPRDLTTKDYKTLLETIELIYSIPDRAGLVKAIFEKLEKWVGLSSGGFMPFDPASGSFDSNSHLFYNIPTEAGKSLMSLFSSRFAAIHPAVCKGVHLNSVNQAVRLSDITSMSLLPDTEYGRDFQPLTPCFYELTMMLGSQGDSVATMGLHRKRHDRDFSVRDKKIMDLLLPHLSRACRNIGIMETLVSSQEIGLIIIGNDNSPLFMNEEARRALNGRPVSIIPDPCLSPYPTYIQTEQGPYRVRTKLVHSGKKNIFLEPAPSRTALSSKLACFGLTPRQEEIALLVIRGLSNREIAEKLFIADQTVKDHLRDVFEKVKIRRRSELSAKIMGF